MPPSPFGLWKPTPRSEWASAPAPTADARSALARGLRSAIARSPARVDEVEQECALGRAQGVSPNDLNSDIQSDILRRVLIGPFRPDVLECLERSGMSFGLTPNAVWTSERAASWCAAGTKAWQYAHDRLGSAAARALWWHNMAHEFDDNTPPHDTPIKGETKLQMLLRVHPPALHVLKGKSETTGWAAQLEKAIAARREDVCVLLLDPNGLGHPKTVSGVVRSTSSRMNYDDFVWLSGLLDRHPAAAQMWSSAHPVSATHKLQVDSRQADNINRILGWSRPSSTSIAKDVSGGALEWAIINNDRSLLVHLSSTEEGQRTLVAAACAAPVLLLSMLNMGLRGDDILKWGGGALRHWRDDDGCCLGHYAAAVQKTLKATDQTIVDALASEPSWDDTNLETLIHNKALRLARSRRALKAVVAKSQSRPPKLRM